MPAKVNPDLCEGCGDCVDVCGPGAIAMVDDKAVVTEDECCECSICVDECPQEAIEMID